MRTFLFSTQLLHSFQKLAAMFSSHIEARLAANAKGLLVQALQV
jgi:hypothetical protein